MHRGIPPVAGEGEEGGGGGGYSNIEAKSVAITWGLKKGNHSSHYRQVSMI